MLIFLPFYWLDQKQLFKHIQIFLRIFPLSNWLRKTNFLSISVLLSEIVTLLNKRRSFQWIAHKCIKTTEKHSLAVCGSFYGEKQFLLKFVPFYCWVMVLREVGSQKSRVRPRNLCDPASSQHHYSGRVHVKKIRLLSITATRFSNPQTNLSARLSRRLGIMTATN